MSFLAELKRRKVLHVAAAYLVAAWLIVQIVGGIEEPLGLSDWFVTVVILLLVFGFPVAVVLGWVLELTTGGVVWEQGRSARPLSGPRWKRSVAIPVIAAPGVLLVAYLAMKSLTGPPPAPTRSGPVSVHQFAIDRPRGMRAVMDGVQPMTITPDGQRVIFYSEEDGVSQLYSSALEVPEAQPIMGTRNAGHIAAVSPDSQWIAFLDRSGQVLKKVPVAGGTAVPLCAVAGAFPNIAWGPDDSIVFTSDEYAGLLRVSSSGGPPDRLTRPVEGEYHKHPDFLPGGDAVVYTVGARGFPYQKSDRVAVVSFATGEQKTLAPGASPQSTPGGQVIFYRDNTLWAVNFDADNLNFDGEPIPVAEGILYAFTAHYSVAEEGTLAYVIPTSLVSRQMVWVDRSGAEQVIDLERRPYTRPRLAPGGDRLAAFVNSGNGADLWVYPLDQGRQLKLTHVGSRDGSATWSPDGTRIYFSANSSGNIFGALADGSAPPERLTFGPRARSVTSITPDGALLVFSEATGAGRFDLATAAVSGAPPPQKLLLTEFEERHGTVSPDGRWLAYASNATGIFEIYLRPFPDVASAVYQVSTIGGRQPVWASDGDELFYWGPQRIMAAEIDTAPDLRLQRIVPLFDHGDYVFEDQGNFDVSADGQRFLMVRKPFGDDAPANRIVIVQNWLKSVAQQLN